MGTKVIFNGKELPDNIKTFTIIKQKLLGNVLISGSVECKDTFILFSNVKSNLFDYYLNEFNNFKTKNKEVKFVIQTHDEQARSLQ